MSDGRPFDPPSPFVTEWAPRIAAMLRGGGQLRPPLAALDVAMGRGRHAPALTQAGFRVFGVDINFDAVADAVRTHGVLGWCADLAYVASGVSRINADVASGFNRSAICRPARFDLVLVTRYLQRNLFPAFSEALRPGGVVLFETFTTAQRRHGRGPASPDHLLEPGELRAYFDRFDVLFYKEVLEPEAVARVVARSRNA